MCNLSDLIWEDGIERGIAQNKKEIALKMLRLGKTEREIFELTELSAEELEMLKNVQGK